MTLQSARPEPIPVFAEMGSINPVFILDKALEKRSSAHCFSARRFCKSGCRTILHQAGYYCGAGEQGAGVLFKIPVRTHFLRKYQLPCSIPVFRQSYYKHILSKSKSRKDVQVSVPGCRPPTEKNHAIPAIASVSAEDFLKNPSLHEEIFGPFSMVIVCQGQAADDPIGRTAERPAYLTLMAEPGELADIVEI